MLRKCQFSLGFVLWEVTLAALALGLFRAASAVTWPDAMPGVFLVLAAFAAMGAAIGGLIGRTWEGVILAVTLAVLAGLLLPAVAVA